MNRKKTVNKYNWIKRGVKFSEEEFEFIYGVYINIDECMLCSKHLIGSDKCLDHNHKTGEPRYILCNNCNKKFDRKLQCNNKLGEKNIYETISNKSEYYVIDFIENKQSKRKYFNKNKYTLEQVKEQRDILLSNITNE